MFWSDAVKLSPVKQRPLISVPVSRPPKQYARFIRVDRPLRCDIRPEHRRVVQLPALRLHRDVSPGDGDLEREGRLQRDRAPTSCTLRSRAVSSRSSISAQNLDKQVPQILRRRPLRAASMYERVESVHEHDLEPQHQFETTNRQFLQPIPYLD